MMMVTFVHFYDEVNLLKVYSEVSSAFHGGESLDSGVQDCDCMWSARVRNPEDYSPNGVSLFANAVEWFNN
jgi:hypothetical protein